MGCKQTPKGPLTVTVLDKDTVVTPENLAREVLLLGRNSAGSWAVKPLGSLSLNALGRALEDPRAAFLPLGESAPADPEGGVPA